MNSPFNNANFMPAPYSTQMNDLSQVLMQAKQNPMAFEEHIKSTNPEAYQRALQIRNSQNPKAIVREMAMAKGINPNVLRMFGLM